MWSTIITIKEYLAQAPEEQVQYIKKIMNMIDEKLPPWFEVCLNYGMLGRVVPHSLYPAGYHCAPELPLPFMNLAYRAKSINFYHMWIYANPKLLERFQDAWKKRDLWKLDMWKSCIRFKKYEQIPHDLLGELATKMTVQDWIDLYEKKVKR